MVDDTWRAFGAEIAGMARRAGMSQAVLATRAGWSRQQISALQRGTRTPKKDQVEAIDAALGANGALIRQWAQLVGRTDIPQWFRQIAVLERSATEITEYQPIMIPGLLQTHAYAHTSIEAGALAPLELEPVVRARTERRSNLLSGVRLRFLISEEAVRASVGDAAVMAEQVRHLRTAMDERIRIGVLPRELPRHPARTPPFRIMSFPDRPKIGYVEHALGGELIDDAADVAELETLMEALVAEALPTMATAELIEKVASEWTV